MIALSVGLPVGALAGYLWAPEELGLDGLGGVLLVWFAGQGLAILSVVEIAVAFATRRRALLIDGALRLLLLVALYDLNAPIHGRIMVGWNYLRSLRPAYACHEGTACADAVVGSVSFGGEMALPACYVELVRLADPRGGRRRDPGPARRLAQGRGRGRRRLRQSSRSDAARPRLLSRGAVR